MSTTAYSTDVVLEPADNQRLANLCGQFDEHLRQIERRLGVEVNNRGNSFRVIGDSNSVHAAEEVLRDLYTETETEALDPARVNLHLQQSGVEAKVTEMPGMQDEVIIQTQRGTIRGRGPNQKQYLSAITHHDVNFGIGPAGTGKTFLAVACAVDALEKDKCRRCPASPQN